MSQEANTDDEDEPVIRRSPLKPAPFLDQQLLNRHVPRGLPKWPPKIDRAYAKSSHVIDGVELLFPEKAPFHTQLNMMRHMIAAFNSSKHALLESPTGTGKSLALLCAAIAFQIHQYKHGATVPFVIIASRTHSQLRSLAGELRRSPYRPLTTTLGSRSRYCQQHAKKRSSVDELCADALNEHSCSYALGVFNKDHADSVSALCRGSNNDVIFDIEDMVTFCGGACPYYTSREIASRSHVIFVPYNYVIDPGISSRLDIFTNSIVIVDEAHNILEIAMDAASAVLDKPQLPQVVLACDQLSKHHAYLLKYIQSPKVKPEMRDCIEAILPITPVRILASKLHSFLCQLQNAAERAESENPYLTKNEYVFWASSPPASASAIRTALTALGITDNLCRHVQEVRRSWQDASDYIRDRYRLLLRVIHPFFEFTYCCCRAWRYPAAFRLLFIRTWGDDAWHSSLRLLCLSAEVIINQQCEGLKSFLVSSGTLSPVPEFCQDLGEGFNARLLSKLQNGHVIDAEKQLLFGALGVGCSSESLCGTRKEQTVSYYRGVGDVIERLCACVPFGVLVFVSSYGALDKFTSEWKRSGSLSNITKFKGAPFIEPSQSSDEEFQSVCNGFRAAAVQGKGAILFAVYRGKASEGISFSNDVCRACICVSLPLPSIVDVRVQAKIAHNNRIAGDGRLWYEQQAYRAVNQALGRVIRHAGDYGLLLLLDKRFASKSNRDISAWLRPHMQNFMSVEELCDKTRDFFDAVQKLKPFRYANTESENETIRKPKLEKKRRTDGPELLSPMLLTPTSATDDDDTLLRTAPYRLAYQQLLSDQ